MAARCGVVGETVVQLTLDQGECLHTVCVVRGLHHSCIVGCDVLALLPCSITSDPRAQDLHFRSAPVRLSTIDPAASSVVKLRRRVCIPARHELCVSGAVRARPQPDVQCDAVFTPDAGPMFRYGYVAAHAVVRCGVQGDVPVRLLNTSDRDVVVPRGTRLGSLSPTALDCDAAEVCAVGSTEEPRGENSWDELGSESDLYDVLHIDESRLTADQRQQVRGLLHRHRHVFAMSSAELGRTSLMEHQIDTGDATPIFQPPRRLPWHQRQEAHTIVDTMLQQGVVSESTSPWSAPIVLVGQKDGSARFCVDYRRLNHVTVKDPYPLPRIDDTLDALGEASFFSTLDLCSGYHQLPVADEARPKTAFSTPDGHYEFNVLPFGVCNGPSAFQRLMTVVLSGLQWHTCLVYIDDIIVFGRTFAEQLTRLEEVFARLATAGLRLKPSKCHLFKDEVEFLGHVVTREGVKTDPAKVHQLVHWARPATVSDVRAFLGFAGYYRRFVRDFATLCRPLHALTQQGRSFEWTDECEHVFCTLKDKLSRAPVLMYPRYGCDAPRFVLDVDASGVGLGAVLSQADSEGCERPVAFASRSLTDTEQRYASTKSELLGIVWAFRHFRCYLLGRPFLVRTDHRALEHLSRFKDPPAIIARWLEFLSEFDYVVQYRAGRSHANADGLSRLPGKASAVASVSANTVAEHVVPSPLVQRRGWTLQDWRDCQSS